MTSWSSGYVSDITYTHGFYRELTPSLLDFAALIQGKKNGSNIKSYCELGCGHGLSMNLLAAANPEIAFYATDFNPEQIAGARELAEEAGITNVTFSDADFAAYADDPGLPTEGFDVIALHGIYSWIPVEHRQSIIEFIQRHLKVGGMVYVSYNCHPGWSSGAPLQRLLSDHAATISGSSVQRMDAAVGFVKRFSEIAGFFRINPQAKRRIERLEGGDRVYLAHEYLNQNWDLFYFADVAADMERAKMSFLGSAHLIDKIDRINLTKDQLEFLSTETDPVRKQGLRDFMVNQQFRRDVFVKGALSHTAFSVREAWLSSRFTLTMRLKNVPKKVKVAQGEMPLPENVYKPLCAELAKGPREFRELLKNKELARLGWGPLAEALTVLVGAGHAQLALPAAEEQARKSQTDAFNAAVCERAKVSDNIRHLASPVTGSGIYVDRFHQIFLAAHRRGEKDPVKSAWSNLKILGQKLKHDGKTLETDQENIAKLSQHYAEFQREALPLLKLLGIG